MNAKTAIVGVLLALAASPALATVELGDAVEVLNLQPDASTAWIRDTRFGTNAGADRDGASSGFGSATLGQNSVVYTGHAPAKFAAAALDGRAVFDLTKSGSFSGWTQMSSAPARWTAFSRIEAGGDVFLNLGGSIVAATNSVTLGVPASVQGVGLIGLMALTLVAATRKAFVLPSFFL